MELLAYISLFLFGFLISNPFLEVEADTCAREWLQYRGNCYGFFNKKLSWEEAEIECQSYARGAHLASILTVPETAIVAEHIAQFQTDPSDVWIGLHDIRQNGKWRWADESTYNYKAFILGEPNNLGGVEYCVELRKVTGFKKWNDAYCRKQNSYICKHEL